MSVSVLLRHALTDLEGYSTHIVALPLRPYQLEPAAAIIDSVRNNSGLSFTVEMARQAGKNELSAQLEAYLLTLYQKTAKNLIKCAPTFKPQVINSKQRLEARLNNWLTRGKWASELGYMVRLGEARVIFYSAEPTAHVVGATAHLGLEFDEAQDIEPEKHDKDFAPMGSTTNCTKIYYGTAWDDRTLLQRQIVANQDAERRDGVRRHFAYPWPIIAEHNPLYGRYVESERDRLGASHPLFRTQYLLETLSGEGGLFSPTQLAQLHGDHERQHQPTPGRLYVAGIDIAGEDEADLDAALRSAKPRKDSTVITIAEVVRTEIAPGIPANACRIVDFLWWTGHKHTEQYSQMLDVLRNVWHVQRVCVDASGVGAGVASFLLAALGEFVVEPFTFSAPSKSALGYDLLAAINAGGFKLYSAGDQDQEAQEFYTEARLAKYEMRAHQQMTFFVPDQDGHDDFIASAALCARAAKLLAAPTTTAIVAPPGDYRDGRY